MGSVSKDQNEVPGECITPAHRQEPIWKEPSSDNASGPPPMLSPPKLLVDGTEVTGAQNQHLKWQNERRRIEKELSQKGTLHWKTHGTSGASYEAPTLAVAYGGQMCPTQRALYHPAAKLLVEYATIGCPTRTCKDLLIQDLEAAIEVGPQISVLDPKVMGQLQAEVADK